MSTPLICKAPSLLFVEVIHADLMIGRAERYACTRVIESCSKDNVSSTVLYNGKAGSRGFGWFHDYDQRFALPSALHVKRLSHKSGDGCGVCNTTVSERGLCACETLEQYCTEYGLISHACSLPLVKKGVCVTSTLRSIVIQGLVFVEGQVGLLGR